jgi:hypothetical protein
VNPTIVLSAEISLVYVLHSSGCHGRLTGGRIERVGATGLRVYNAYDSLFEYLSGNALRSWCVIDLHGKPMAGWNAVLPQDMYIVVSYAEHQNDKAIGASE